MKPRILARKFLLLASLLNAAAAFAHNAAKAASEEIYVLGEFRVNTAKDDSFIATESTSGTRTGACGPRLGYGASGRHWRTTPVHFTESIMPTRADAAVEIIAGNRLRLQPPSVERPIAMFHGWRAHPTDWLFNADGLPTAPFS